MRIYLLQAMVFLASFLLFQIELILGKLILPGFGGGYLVWGISMVFYQGVLLLGYLHLHMLNRYFRFAQWIKWQTVLILGSLLVLPLSVERLQNPSYQLPLVVEIIRLLAVVVGLLFFILAGLSICAQLVLASSDLPEKKNPYILYAGSNLGAFASLLLYPFVFEPNFDLSVQLWQWEVGYIVLAVLFLVVLWVVPRAEGEEGRKEKIIWPEGRRVGQWLLLSAAPSAMFLSTTNAITFDIAPVPLLWILPLAIYLLTLVLSFKSRPFCPPWIQKRFYLAVYAGIFLFLFKATSFSLSADVEFALSSLKISHHFFVILLVVLLEPLLLLTICFVVCLVCHYQLSQVKPAGSGGLTAFYITLALGGFLGGVLVNWIVPVVFNVMIETLISFFLGAYAFSLLHRDKVAEPAKFLRLLAAIVALVILWLNVTTHAGEALGRMVSVILALVLLSLFYLLKEHHRQISWVLFVLIVLSPFLGYLNLDRKIVFQGRDYYGIFKVYDEGGFRRLHHGTTLHGARFLDASRRGEALTYYEKETPIGEFLLKNPLNYSRIGLIGLGVGSLAVYARPGDQYDFFELDPLVGEIAKRYFGFLEESRGKIRVVYGDGRISLRKEPSRKYDALIVDVFNGGSIPVHLLTVEAVREYRRVLKPNGILFFHVSNHYLDLVPVLYAVAGKLELHGLIKSKLGKNPPEREASIWFAMTADARVSSLLQSSLAWRHVQVKATRPWTDRYSSLVSAMY
ncbi:MAG: spermidine synthase [Nitrospinales bacterium]